MTDEELIDLVESGDYQHAERTIKFLSSKYPKNSFYVVLKQYNLYRLGNVKLALEGCTQLLEQAPTDPRATNLLYKIFFLEGKEKELNMVYENVIKRYPNNCKDLVQQWFENTVKYKTIKGTQKACFHLSKLYPGERLHKFRAAFTNYLLASEVKKDQKQYELFCSLGYKMIEEFTPENTQELFVFVKVLENKKEKALEHIEAFDKQLDLDVKLLYLALLNELENYQKLYEVSETYLYAEQFNDYDTWKLFILAGFKIGKPFEELKTKINEYKWSRNSQLAIVELCKVYGSEEIEKSIKLYYDKLKTKLCCFNDIVSYSPEPTYLVDLVEQTTEETLKKEKTSANLNILINNQKLLHYFGKVDEAFFELNWKIYQDYFKLCESKPDTDFYGANELILLNTIHSLNKDSSYANVYKAIVTLQFLRSSDAKDFRVNLWLMKLMRLVGLSPDVFQIYEFMKVTMIQHDSLGYFITKDASTLYAKKQAINQLVNIFRFYLTCEGTMPDNALQAFEGGVYNKIQNFLSFDLKLSNSYQYYECVLEVYRLVKNLQDNSYGAYFRNKILEIEPKIQKIQLSDNRDTKIFWKNFGFKQEFIEAFETRFGAVKFSEEVSLLKLKYAKEVMLLKPSEQRFKTFNKLLSSSKYPKIDAWFMKVYSSAFKLNQKLEKPEADSSINFLKKNLKLSKVIKPDVLSADLNKVNLDVIELYKDLKYHKNKEVSQLVAELRKLDDSNKKAQMEALDEVHKAMIPGGPITTEFISEQMDKFHDSLVKVSYIHLLIK